VKPVYRRFPLPSGDQGQLALRRILRRQHPKPEHAPRLCAGVQRFFGWCDDHGLTLTTLRPFDVGEWIEQLQEKHGPAGVNQQLAGVRMMFNWLITGQVAPVNPAAVVRDPKLVRGVFALRKGMLETIPLSGQARSALYQDSLIRTDRPNRACRGT
jgi:hypothetical protein